MRRVHHLRCSIDVPSWRRAGVLVAQGDQPTTGIRPARHWEAGQFVIFSPNTKSEKRVNLASSLWHETWRDGVSRRLKPARAVAKSVGYSGRRDNLPHPLNNLSQIRRRGLRSDDEIV